MFGHIKVRMRAAPGRGIVSSLVLQSDTLDEIDFEWLGADPTEVQSNYFGKGDTSSYTRGAFHQTPENQQNFVDYDIDWTPEQIVWSINGEPVRVLTPETAEANKYPQTPMQVKFGAWSGGDPANPEGTINWAKGPTDYSQGPFNMIVESIEVSDYSTGSAYRYTDNSGNVGGIEAVNGAVGGNRGETPVVVVPTEVQSASNSVTSGPIIPPGIGYTADPSGQDSQPPMNGSNGLGRGVPMPSVAGVPEGWVVTSTGKIVPISDAVLGKSCSMSHLHCYS